jgi:zinc transporter 9
MLAEKPEARVLGAAEVAQGGDRDPQALLNRAGVRSILLGGDVRKPPSSQRAVIAAIFGNGFVALIKFLAFYLSGSDAMLSEGVHSIADTGNQVLLLIGIRLSLKRGDDDFQYGYGSERYIFGLLSAAGIFFLGCGVTIYHGVNSLILNRLPAIGWTTFIVLGVSAIIEGVVFLVALRSILAEKKEMPLFAYLRERADPAAVAILLEDGLAVFGLGLASLGILATHFTSVGLWDSIASIAIGVLLGVIAVYLAIENRELLLGRAVPDDAHDRFVAILEGWPGVRGVRDVKTRQLTPEAYILKAEIAFDEKLLLGRLDKVMPVSPPADDRERHEALRALAKCALLAIATEIDAIESAVRREIPEARHIDLELDRSGGPDPPSLDGTKGRPGP